MSEICDMSIELNSSSRPSGILEEISSLLHDRNYLETEKVEQIFKSLDLETSDLLGYLVNPEGEPYGRKVIYDDGHFEVLVTNWDKLESCLPHDHGDSQGWVYVVEGKVKNTTYSYGENMKFAEIAIDEISQRHLFHAPKGTIHDMRPLSSRLITVHIYWPPINNMNIIDNVQDRGGCLVDSTCGAWWPENEINILKRFPVSIQ